MKLGICKLGEEGELNDYETKEGRYGESCTSFRMIVFPCKYEMEMIDIHEKHTHLAKWIVYRICILATEGEGESHIVQGLQKEAELLDFSFLDFIS